jgi:D-alanyl-D-alanine carboxypeptidase/D-alanyl-D-alanine-endopeptidase (penicillin-binding protein 4)
MKPTLRLLAVSAVVLAGPPAAAQANGTVSLDTAASRLGRLFAEPSGPKLSYGVVVGWADEPKPFFEKNGAAPLIPASNQKLLTAAAAVLLLGMQHEIRTELIAHGPIVDGVLEGALRVRGEGDPTFGARDHGETLAKLAFFAERLKERGIDRVEGPLLVDDSAFDQEFVGPEWPKGDLRTTYYLAQVAALALDDGCVRVIATPGQVGRPAGLAIVPDVGHARLRNGVTTAGTKPGGLRFERDEGANEISVTGTIGRGSAPQRHDVAIHDPAMHFGRALRLALRQAGIEADGDVARAGPDERKVGEVLIRYGTPIAHVLPAMLKESMNTRAEMLAKHVGYATGAGGTFAGAGAAVKKALEQAGVPSDDLVIADGSGLSRANRLTARSLHGVLVAVLAHPAGEQFRESLAEPGEEGTLRRRLAGLEGRVFAKTGTLNGVSALSGYVQARSGRWLAFAVLMNGTDPNMRKTQDAVVELLSSLAGEG